MNELQVFDYKGNKVRTIEKDGETWWVLKDICGVLGLTNPTVIADRLDEDEVTKFDLGSKSGISNIINESGLYNVILRSDKPEAKPFRKWVTSEVLPSIRKTGEYSVNETQNHNLASINRMAKILKAAYKDAGVDPAFTAVAINNIYEELTGIFLPLPITIKEKNG